MTALRQLSRFGFVGILATVVHVGVGLGLHDGAGLNPFFGQTRLTFPDSTADARAFLRFITVSVSVLGLNQLIVWVVTSFLGRPYWLALAVIIVSVPMVTFVLLKFWALRR
jgi:putative flippase GtrA